MTEPHVEDARNDNASHDEPAEDGELANPGPVPPAPEDATDTGERPGDLAPQAGGPAGDDED